MVSIPAAVRESSGQFIRNAWYVVAWDYEVLDDALFERTILGESVIVYRAMDGAPVVMENRCCHRAAPLSLGRKEGDCIRCMYHGLRFDRSGVCVEIPGQARIPADARVKIFPAVQRTRLIWVWMGDPLKADATLIPDTYSVQHPAWASKPGYKNFGANLLLLADNLLDFAHLSYVHENTLGGSTAIAEAPPVITGLEQRGIRIVRRVSGVEPAPYHRQLGQFKGLVNRWWDYTLSISGMFIMNSGVQSAHKSEGDLDGALLFHSCQALTPETADSTHYFFSHAHNFAIDDAAVIESIYRSIVTAFDEDKRMIEAQRFVMARQPQRPLVGIAADGALVRFRRLFNAALAAEQNVATDASRAREVEAEEPRGVRD
ncbi:MAG TPA: aromatic ring-hydroxylating dioxygenase subunit alpha [Steroidobacteraceae bacterium]|nr:aromatic ring-hydroxylating dioxygenase subunit alpha [Steroidobacteraceae bacterium]